MARDYYDESKDKKKKNNKEDAFSPRSLGQQQKGSTVDKTQTGSTTTSQSSSSSNSTNNVIERSSRSTFMGGGSRVSSNPTTSSRSTAPNEQPVQRTESRVKSAADKRATVTQKRYSEPIGPSTQRTETRRSLLDRADDFFRTFTDKSNEWEKNNVPARMTPERRTQIDTKNRTAAQNVSQRYQDRMGISDEDKALADYTAGVIKRKALGYAKTASKAVQTNEGKKFSGRWAQEDPEFARHISSHDFAQRADKAFNDYSAQQEKTQKRLTQIENNTSEAGRIALQAYGSGIEMGIDRLAGPLWAASMFASVYGNQRGNALAEGATDEQDARAAFLSAGLEVATEYMFRPAVGIASKFGGPHSLDFAGKLASKVSGKLTGRAAKLADIGIRTLGSMAEENVEELVGWIADPYLQNAAYKNELQKTREEQAHADYEEMQSAFWSQFGTEEEAQEAALHVNSDDFVNDLTETYKASGASDEEARSMAKIMQKYFLAHFDNDEKAAEEAEEAMDSFVVGDVRAHHSWKELAETFASTSLLTGLTGGASAYSTYQMGNQILNSPNGKVKVADYSNLVQNFDEENTKEAKGIKETIDKGDTPTGTQVYQVASQATEVMSELDQKNTASNQVKDRRMRAEGLTVSPVVMTPQGPRMNEMTEQAYRSSYEKTGLDEDVLTDRDTMNTAAHLVAAFETGTITAEEIATELTVDHPEMRTIFEMATGVDLSQYDVQKDGGFYNEVDAVKSNRAMLDGLLAKSSDNYVQMAQAEQKQWENRTRGEVHKAMTNSFGAMGNLAMHPVLKTADTTDQGKYMLTARMAQRVYDYARRTDDEWNDIKRSLKRISRSVDMDAMKLVYDAAKYDKQVSETPYYGRTVESGTAMGFAKGISSEAMERGTFRNESNRELDGDEDEAYTSVAFQTGLNIRLVPAEQLEQVKKDEKGNIVLDEDGNEVKISTNGKYDRKTGTIYLADSNSFGDNINIALSHEMTHHLAVFAPEAYMALSNYVMDRWYKLSPESYSNSIKNIQKLYKSVGQDLSEEEALEEIIADATRDFWNDPEFVEGFTTDNEPSIIRKVINAIKDVVRKIRSILSSGNVSEDYEHYLWNILGSYTEAEKLWLNAYKEAQTRASEKAIDEWQDAVNGNVATERDDRFSIVEDKNLIKKLDADDHITTYRGMVKIDGKYYSPMSSKVRNEKGKYELREGMEPGQWVEASITTDPKMFYPDGRYRLMKDNGKPIPAAYNPYMHSSTSMMNDQFETQYKRPNLVVVEGVIPKSEVDSGIRVEHDLDDGRHVIAKDPAGIAEWKPGPIERMLPEDRQRTVYLSNHFKMVREVPAEEVAKHIHDKLEGTGVAMTYNSVTPDVRRELQKLGTKMEQNKQKKYYVEGAERFSISDDLDAFHDYIMKRKESAARWTDERIDSLIDEYGASNPNYSQAYATLISPKDFLKLTLDDEVLSKWNKAAESIPAEYEGMNYQEKKTEWKRQLKETGEATKDNMFMLNQPLDEAELRNYEFTPQLGIIPDKYGTEVMGHEGRHRMRALMEAGIKSVPVVIYEPSEKTKLTKTHINSMTLTAQDHGYGPVNNNASVTLHDLVPIKSSNRDELIQKFGGEAQVRFSLNNPANAKHEHQIFVWPRRNILSERIPCEEWRKCDRL